MHPALQKIILTSLQPGQEDLLNIDMVKEEFLDFVFSEVQEELVRRQVHYYQKQFTDLINRLSPSPAARDFVKQMIDLLDHVEQSFPLYFNPDEIVPQAKFAEHFSALDNRRNRLIKSINAIEISSALKNCITGYLQHEAINARSNLTYRGLRYFNSFLDNLESLLTDKNVKNWESSFQQAMIRLGFNHLGFLAYFQESVRDELVRLLSADDQRSFLRKKLSLIKSQVVKPDTTLDPAWPGIKTMLEEWFAEQLSYLPAPYENNAHFAEDKLLLNMPVSQIACIARLLYEQGVYGNASVTEVLKFITDHYASKKRQHISAGSLSKEYYAINQVTAAVVKDLLQRMTGKLCRQYFPVS